MPQLRIALALAAAALAFFTGCVEPRRDEPAAHAEGAATRNRDTHGPADVEPYIRALEAPGREAYMPTRRIVELLQLRGDEDVADLGCGPGVVTMELARALPRGRVYAIDVEPAQLDRLNAKLTHAAIRNVMPILCTPESPRLPDRSADWILIIDTFHHLDRREVYLKGLAAALKPGGRIVNVDFKEGKLPVGPGPDHKLPRAQMLREFESAGYSVEREVTEFQYHDFFIFAPR